MKTQVKSEAWKVTFENSGVLTVFADSELSAIKAAENRAQEYGWNLRAIKADQLNKHAQALGRLGGKAGRGHVKARTSEQARQAVMVRWNKVKAQKEQTT